MPKGEKPKPRAGAGRILVLHGPNLNLLGVREPSIYGAETLESLDRRIAAEASRLGYSAESFQSNHEGDLIDRVQSARTGVAGVLINPGGLTHTSVALRDAIAAITVPVIEVHLSNTLGREEFRKVDLVAPVCRGVVMGFGGDSYLTALGALDRILTASRGRA